MVEKNPKNLNVDVTLKNILENEAKEISNWKYEKKYSVYNYPPWEEMCEQKWGITIKEVRSTEYYGLYNILNDLIGYFRLHKIEDYILVSLGLKPNLCGRKLGDELMKNIIIQSQISYPNIKKIVLEVRSFNKRAIRCYLKNGFKLEYIYIKDTLTGRDIFFWMVFYI